MMVPTDDMVRGWATSEDAPDDLRHVPHPDGAREYRTQRNATARLVVALQRRVADLTDALAREDRILTGNEAGRHVGRLMRQFAERHPALRDGLLAIAEGVEQACASGDEELAYQRGRRAAATEIATLTSQRDKAMALASELAELCSGLDERDVLLARSKATEARARLTALAGDLGHEPR